MQNTESPRYFHGWRLTRRETRAVKNLLVLTGDVGAAEKLLRHSIAYGHSRLVVRRYLLARALGSAHVTAYERHFSIAIQDITAEELDRAKQDVVRRARALLRLHAATPATIQGPDSGKTEVSVEKRDDAIETISSRGLTTC